MTLGAGTGAVGDSERNSARSQPRSHRRPARSQAAALPGSTTKLLGQRIMVGMTGTLPSPKLLAAVRAGQVGSVILFADNIVSRRQTLALTGALQRAARAGGNSKLLIATDQEGGEVKRLPTGPPTLSPPQMAAPGELNALRAALRSGQLSRANADSSYQRILALKDRLGLA